MSGIECFGKGTAALKRTKWCTREVRRGFGWLAQSSWAVAGVLEHCTYVVVLLGMHVVS